MMKEITLDDENIGKLENFKRIFEAIIEEELEFNEYANAVISIGLDKMLRDAIPEGQEWNTLALAFEEKYEFMSDLVAGCWKRGKDISAKDKQAVREKISQYIH